MVVELKLRTFQIGNPPKRGEGLRIGATRRPPRGIPRDRWQRDGYFDVWLPVLAPSTQLLSWAKTHDLDDTRLKRFFERYERDMLRETDSRQTISLLAQLAMRTPISIGCYCANEARCHRSVLRKLIERAHRTGLRSK